MPTTNQDIWILGQIAHERQAEGHELLSLMRHFLDFPSYDFGSSIECIGLLVYLKFTNPATMDKFREHSNNFYLRDKQKPKIRFNRHSRFLSVGYLSNASSAEVEFAENSSDAETFSKFCLEFIDVLLGGLRKRLKPTDDFKIDEFEALLRKKRSELPIDEQTLSLVRAKKDNYQERTTWNKPRLDLPRNPSIPKLIYVRKLDRHTDTIGKYKDGFFWGHVVPGYKSVDEEVDASTYLYSVLHKFDSNGTYLESKFERTATSENYCHEVAYAKLIQMVEALGKHTFEDIRVDLFNLYIDGMLFGLIDESYDDGEAIVMMRPDDLEFTPPWDGYYGT